jgi:hypothetical protein
MIFFGLMYRTMEELTFTSYELVTPSTQMGYAGLKLSSCHYQSLLDGCERREMSDFDELIGHLVQAIRTSAVNGHIIDYYEARKALTDAISALTSGRDVLKAKLDGYKLMMESETLEKLGKSELIMIIHGWHCKDHSYQCDIARLEAQLKEANADAERFISIYRDYTPFKNNKYRCRYCGCEWDLPEIGFELHEDNCPVMLHRARLAKDES